MDEKTHAALMALAQKLGVTVELLWGVMLKQAPIEGAIALATAVFVATLAVAWLIFVNKKTTSYQFNQEFFTQQEWQEEGAFLAWCSVVVVGAVAAMILIVDVGTAVTAFSNPEYWALKTLLKL